MHSRHLGRTRFSPLLPIGINPLPFRKNNKPAETEEELISDPKSQLPLLSLSEACGETSQHSLLARSWSLNTKHLLWPININPLTYNLRLGMHVQRVKTQDVSLLTFSSPTKPSITLNLLPIPKKVAVILQNGTSLMITSYEDVSGNSPTQRSKLRFNWVT